MEILKYKIVLMVLYNYNRKKNFDKILGIPNDL